MNSNCGYPACERRCERLFCFTHNAYNNLPRHPRYNALFRWLDVSLIEACFHLFPLSESLLPLQQKELGSYHIDKSEDFLIDTSRYLWEEEGRKLTMLQRQRVHRVAAYSGNVVVLGLSGELWFWYRGDTTPLILSPVHRPIAIAITCIPDIIYLAVDARLYRLNPRTKKEIQYTATSIREFTYNRSGGVFLALTFDGILWCRDAVVPLRHRQHKLPVISYDLSHIDPLITLTCAKGEEVVIPYHYNLTFNHIIM